MGKRARSSGPKSRTPSQALSAVPYGPSCFRSCFFSYTLIPYIDISIIKNQVCRRHMHGHIDMPPTDCGLSCNRFPPSFPFFRVVITALCSTARSNTRCRLKLNICTSILLFLFISRSVTLYSASDRLGCVPALSQPSYLAAAGRRIVA